MQWARASEQMHPKLSEVTALSARFKRIPPKRHLRGFPIQKYRPSRAVFRHVRCENNTRYAVVRPIFPVGPVPYKEALESD